MPFGLYLFQLEHGQAFEQTARIHKYFSTMFENIKNRTFKA